MKKVLTFLFSVFLICGLFVSCNNSAVEEKNGLASVSFEESILSTKALSATIETKAVEEVYWRYTAVKNDSGPSQGATASLNEADALPVWGTGTASAGLKGKVVTGLSAGSWKFRLYGYTDATTATDKKVYDTSYTGTDGATGTVKASQIAKVKVNVKPVASGEGNGTLAIKGITAAQGEPKSYWYQYKTNTDASFSAWEKITSPSDTGITKDLSVGIYTVRIGAFYSHEAETAPTTNPEREGSIAVQIYANLTTKVSGSIDDLTGGVEFDAEIDTPTPKHFMVTYNANGANGGDVPVDTKAYKSGDPVTVLGNTATEPLTKTDYVFKGWTTSTDSSATVLKENDTFTITEDTTLYAKWAPPVVYSYRNPTYNTEGDPASGIKSWSEENVEGEVTVIDNSYSGTKDVTWDAGWYVVTGDNVSIDGMVTCNGDVKLLLTDGCKLTVVPTTSDRKTAIAVDNETLSGTNKLTIYGQTSGTGTLIATGHATNDGNNAHGIGGYTYSGSNITINGGTVTATGASNDGIFFEGGAGIGGGTTAGNITINGGTVTAIGKVKGAGIGAGISGGTVSNVVINGGDVFAVGGSKISDYQSAGGAGIGGGAGKVTSESSVPGGDASNITINGGNVWVTATVGGAGIGGGAGGFPNDYSVVTAQDGSNGGSASSITINGGKINVAGVSGGGAGIGGGAGGAGANPGTDYGKTGGLGGNGGSLSSITIATDATIEGTPTTPSVQIGGGAGGNGGSGAQGQTGQYGGTGGTGGTGGNGGSVENIGTGGAGGTGGTGGEGGFGGEGDGAGGAGGKGGNGGNYRTGGAGGAGGKGGNGGNGSSTGASGADGAAGKEI